MGVNYNARLHIFLLIAVLAIGVLTLHSFTIQKVHEVPFTSSHGFPTHTVINMPIAKLVPSLSPGVSDFDIVSELYVAQHLSNIDVSSLRMVRAHEVVEGTHTTTYLSYVQEKNSLPVLNKKTHFVYTSDAGGTLYFIKNELLPDEELPFVDVSSLISSSESKAAVHAAFAGVTSILPLHTHASDGLGLYASESGEIFPAYVYEVQITADVEMALFVVVDAYEGAVVETRSLDVHIPVSGQIDSNFYQSTTQTFDYSVHKQIVHIYDASGAALVQTATTNASGGFALSLPPGSYIARYAFNSTGFYIHKELSVGEANSVVSVPIVVPSSGQLTIPSLYWPDDGEISYFDPYMAESTTYFHVRDLFDMFVDDLGMSEIEEGTPLKVRLLGGNNQDGCLIATGQQSYLNLGYRTSGSTTNPSPSTLCNGAFNEWVTRHEMGHSFAARVGYTPNVETSTAFNKNFPYQNPNTMFNFLSIHEGQADYWGHGTRLTPPSWPAFENWMDYYAEDVYDTHKMGNVITVGGRDLQTAIGTANNGVNVTRRLFAEAIRMIPINLHEFVELLIVNDQAIYGGAHIEDICQEFARDRFIVVDSCFSVITQPSFTFGAIKADMEHTPFISRPESNILPLTFDVTQPTDEYMIGVAPIASSSYQQVFSSGTISTCPNCNDLTYNLNLAPYSDGLYKIRFTSRVGTNNYHYKILLGLAPYRSGFPVSFPLRVHNEEVALFDTTGDGMMELFTASDAVFTLNGGEYPQIHGFTLSGVSLSNFPFFLETPAGLTGPLENPTRLYFSDFDGDGITELLTVGGSGGRRYHLNGSYIPQSHILVPTSLGSLFYSSLDDFTLDGVPEIVTQRTAFFGTLYPPGTGPVEVTDINGTRIFISGPTLRLSGVSTADLFGGPAPELVLVNGSSRLQVYSTNGTKWLDVALPGVVGTKPAIGDVDNDGAFEIVVNTGVISVIELSGSITTFNAAGQGVSVNSSVALGDVDGNGDLEIFAATTNSIKGFHHTGQGIVLASGGGYTTTTSILLDSNSYGTVVGDSRTISCVLSEMSPVIGDINGDGDQEVLIASNSECPFVYAFEHTGAFVSGWPKAVEYLVEQCYALNPPVTIANSNCATPSLATFAHPTPLITDADADGLIEIIIVSNNQLYVFDLSAPYNSANIDWPQYGHDAWRTGNAEFIVPFSAPACDGDGDGFTSLVCGGSDCDDANGGVNPGASEICGDGIDNNCDFLIDGADPSCVSVCTDSDDDGYSVEGGGSCCGVSGSQTCFSLPDCNDASSAVHPGGAEALCSDTLDNNCNGAIDCADSACFSNSACISGCTSNAQCGGSTPYCNTALNTCVACLTPAHCPSSGNECLPSTCSAGVCGIISIAGSSCTQGIACGTGTCSASAPFGCVGVTTLDCGNPTCAQEPACIPTGCTSNAQCGGSTPLCDLSTNECVGCLSSANCDDGVMCNGVEMCTAAQQCQGGTSIDCSGLSNQCNTGMCVEGAGCTQVAFTNGVFCSDGDTCTAGDSCQSGQCVPTGPTCSLGESCTAGTGNCVPIPGFCTQDSECSDGNQCTSDTCASNSCTNTITSGASCDDGNVCTQGSTCSSTGLCQAGTPVSVSDGISCTLDTCFEPDGIAHTPSDALCPDGLFCNGPDTCSATLGCQTASSPCSAWEMCDEVEDACNECELLSADWSVSEANEGESVSLSVTGQYCEGMELMFTLYEDDISVDEDSGDDAVSVQPISVLFINGVANGTWIAEYQIDCVAGACDPPEYHFVASLVTNPSISLQSGLLIVEEQGIGATAGVCGDGSIDTGEQCDDGDTTSGDGCSSSCTTESSSSNNGGGGGGGGSSGGSVQPLPVQNQTPALPGEEEGSAEGEAGGEIELPQPIQEVKDFFAGKAVFWLAVGVLVLLVIFVTRSILKVMYIHKVRHSIVQSILEHQK